MKAEGVLVVIVAQSIRRRRDQVDRADARCDAAGSAEVQACGDSRESGCTVLARRRDARRLSCTEQSCVTSGSSVAESRPRNLDRGRARLQIGCACWWWMAKHALRMCRGVRRRRGEREYDTIGGKAEVVKGKDAGGERGRETRASQRASGCGRIAAGGGRRGRDRARLDGSTLKFTIALRSLRSATSLCKSSERGRKRQRSVCRLASEPRWQRQAGRQGRQRGQAGASRAAAHPTPKRKVRSVPTASCRTNHSNAQRLSDGQQANGRGMEGRPHAMKGGQHPHRHTASL